MQHQAPDRSASDLLIVPEVAKICRVSGRTIRHWIHVGKLKSLRVGRRHLVRRSDVAALFATSTGEAEPKRAAV